MDPLKEEVEALKEKIRQMDSDINDYKTKLSESKDVAEQKLTASMKLKFFFFLQHFFMFNICYR